MKDLDIFSDRDPVKPDLDAVVYSTRKDNIKEEHPLVEEQTKMADEKIVTNEDEKKAEAPPANKMLPFPKLFMFSSICDKTIVAFGFILAVTGGAVAPVMSLVFGKLIDILGISIILWTAGYFQYAFMQHMAEKLSFDLRSRYLRSLMNQETAYFEK
jgi:hypothetical protein